MTELEEVINVFSDVLERPVIVAGGAVRDHLRSNTPKDFDVFMLNQSWQDWESYKAKFAEKFTERLSQFPKVESKIEWHKSEPFLLETILFNGKEIQLMATLASSILDLIKDFDWDVCCFGFDGRDYTYNPDDLSNIQVGNYLRLNKLTFPYSTLRRGYRFSERFTMRIHKDDITAICKQILEIDAPKEKSSK